MKKIIFFVFVLLAIFLGYTLSKIPIPNSNLNIVKPKEVLKVALVTDSHNDNDLLARVLDMAKARKVDFVIGLGDWSSIGTVSELTPVDEVFAKSGLNYQVIPGDHDEWASRNAGVAATQNFVDVFGGIGKVVEQEGVRFIIVDNADIYRGISPQDWQAMLGSMQGCGGSSSAGAAVKLCFVLAHKSPYHPDSAHIMGQTTPAVAAQAKEFANVLQEKKIDGFFSGDMHFFAEFKSPDSSVRMTTIGAVTRQPNPQGPRFGILTVFDDNSWEIEDVEIR